MWAHCPIPGEIKFSPSLLPLFTQSTFSQMFVDQRKAASSTSTRKGMDFSKLFFHFNPESSLWTKSKKTWKFFHTIHLFPNNSQQFNALQHFQLFSFCCSARSCEARWSVECARNSFPSSLSLSVSLWWVKNTSPENVTFSFSFFFAERVH